MHSYKESRFYGVVIFLFVFMNIDDLYYYKYVWYVLLGL